MLFPTKTYMHCFSLMAQAFGRRDDAGVCGFLGVAFFCAEEALAATGEAAFVSAFVSDGTGSERSFADFESVGFFPFPGVAALAGTAGLLPPACFNAFSFLLSLKLGLCFVRFTSLAPSFLRCFGGAAAAFAEPALATFGAGVFTMAKLHVH